MHYFIAHRLCIPFAHGLAFACLLCAAAAPQAAGPASPGQASRHNDLPLQFSFSMARPLGQHAPVQAADDAASEEDCVEEEDIAPIASIPYTPPEKPLPPAKPPVASNDPALAKPAPAPQLKENRVPSPSPQTAASPIATQPAQASPPAPPMQATQVPPTAPAPTWEISLADKTLSVALGRWAQTAGWQLLWELPVDYTIEARTIVPGTFEEAVETVANSMETADTAMQAIFYKGNKVLRIVAKGGE